MSSKPSPKAAPKKAPPIPPVSTVLKGTASLAKETLEAFRDFGKDKRKVLQDAKKKTDLAFKGFSLSTAHPSAKASPRYVLHGEDPSVKQGLVFTDKLKKIPAEDAAAKRTLRLRFTEAQIRGMGLSVGGDGRVRGSVPLRTVMEHLSSSTGGGAALDSLRERLTACRIDGDAEGRLAEASACADEASTGTAAGTSSTPTPAGGDGASTPAGNGSGTPAGGMSAADLVAEQLARQMAHVTAPEVALTYGVERNGQITAVLKPGAADVTSFHDFSDLKIAFESLWTEMFDKGVESLGRSLYEEIVRREDWTLPDGTSRLQTVSDMRDLLDSYRSSRAVGDGTPVPSGMYDLIQSPDLDRVWPLFTNEQRSMLMGYLTAFSIFPVGGLFGFGGSDQRDAMRAEATALFNRLAASVQEREGRIDKLMASIDARLNESYKFDVFAAGSINYGLLLTYRQAWEPQNYQVGDLISTLPLAPKEVRRYTTKQVTRKSRAQKELEDTQESATSSSSNTSRAESEIVKRASNTTSFNQTAEGSVSVGVFEGRFSTSFGVEAQKESSDTKRNFREAVLNAAQEYRHQHKVEVETSTSEERESTTFGEITNPNDEITVTYLFYELERQYKVSERIHRLTPVIMVANEVPSPSEIDAAWLMANSWILKRVILDESFLPALDYLTTSVTGDELALDVLRTNMERQGALVDALINQVQEKTRMSTEAFDQLRSIVTDHTPDDVNKMKDVALALAFGPLGLFGSGDDGAQQKREDMAKMSLERSDKDLQQFSAKLTSEISAMKEAVDRYTKELQAHFDRQAAVARLRMHVKDNILFYMHAIWDYEPTDQRLFRLYNTEVDWFEHTDSTLTVTIEGGPAGGLGILPGPFGGRGTFEVTTTIPLSGYSRVRKKLSDVADLDGILGYKGNYMLFPVKEPSYLHWYMMQDYVDPVTGGLRDPDEFANMTTDELVDAICCLKRRDPAAFEASRPDLLNMIKERLSSSRPESDLVIVPSGSLYIEALPGKHPVLEDFKLVHRAIDVKKVQSEVRRAELENLRLAARLLEGEREDPEVDRKIVVQGGAAAVITPSES